MTCEGVDAAIPATQGMNRIPKDQDTSTLLDAWLWHTFEVMPKMLSAKLPQPLKLSHMAVSTSSIQTLNLWDQ
jgi:hypothetical protein